MSEVAELKPFIQCPYCGCGSEANIEIMLIHNCIGTKVNDIMLLHTCRCGEEIDIPWKLKKITGGVDNE